jgi:hypothetical protein
MLEEEKRGRSGVLEANFCLPAGMDIDCVLRVADFAPFQVVGELIESGHCAKTVRAAFEIAGCPQGANRVLQSYQLLKKRDGGFADQCLRSNGVPPRSAVLENHYAPDCFKGWQRVSYDLAKGDAALAFAWILKGGTGTMDGSALEKLIDSVTRYTPSEVFDDVINSRNELLTRLKNYDLLPDPQKFLSRPNLVNLGQAAAAVRQTVTEALTVAESAYRRAAVHDPQHGCGWLRLARLKWLTAHFREALRILIGPHPDPDLQACQLPLAVAIRVAGGNLVVRADPELNWNGPAGVATEVSVSGETLVLRYTEAGVVGERQCEISGLLERDRILLTEFFQKYDPGMLNSAGTVSFEDWIRLVAVPSLGRRGMLAEAVDEKVEFAILAACVHLGVPDSVGLAPGCTPEPRPSEWLEESVVSEIQ